MDCLMSTGIVLFLLLSLQRSCKADYYTASIVKCKNESGISSAILEF